MTRAAWLASLAVGDLVAVHCNGARINVEAVTSTSRTLITIGKHAKKGEL